MVVYQLLLATAAAATGVPADSTLHASWGLTSDDCSLDRLPSTHAALFNGVTVPVERAAVLVPPSAPLRHAGSLLTAKSKLKTDDLVSETPDPRLLQLLKEISDWIIKINVGSNELYSRKSYFCRRYPSYIFINGNLAR